MILGQDGLSDAERIKILKTAIANELNPRNDILFADEIIKLARGKGYTEYIHYAYMSQGNAYKILGNNVTALDYYFKAADFSKENGYDKGIGEAYATIAGTYKQIENFKLAVDYYKKASEIFINLNDSLNLGFIYVNLGYGYYSVGKYDSARLLTLQGEPIISELYPKALNYVQGNLALINIRLGEAAAFEALEITLQDLRSKGDDFAVSDYLSQLSGILRDQGRVDEAIEAGEESLMLSRKLGLKEQIRDASENLCDLYAQQGQYQKALEYQTQFIIYKDSINNLEVVNQIGNLRTEFEVGEEKAKVDLLMAQRKVRNIYGVALLIGLGSVLVLAIIQYYNSRQRKRTNRLLIEQKSALESQKEQLEQQKAELETLNSTKDRFFSIISHDLRGPVNAFYGVSRMIKFFVQNKQMDQLEVLAEEIDQSVDRLSALLDNLLNWAVQQQGEFPYVPEKINIKAMAEDLVDVFTTMARSKQITLKAHVSEELEAWADRNTTMTIIRNLVSNALKFTSKGGVVEVLALADETYVKIQVRDNGVGIAQDKLDQLFRLSGDASTWGTAGEKGLGLGLQLVHEFVELNAGKIDVRSQEKEGTTFTIWLPEFTLEQVSAEA